MNYFNLFKAELIKKLMIKNIHVCDAIKGVEHFVQTTEGKELFKKREFIERLKLKRDNPVKNIADQVSKYLDQNNIIASQDDNF